MFVYCNNNPINAIDLGGQLPKWLRGALNLISGVVQVSLGAALGATVGWTGGGAIVAGILIANGSATATQGVGQIVNDVTNTDVMYEENVLRTGAEHIGSALGGEIGGKVATIAYDTVVFAAELYAGNILLQQKGILPKKVSIDSLQNNPSDEFVTLGPADGVVEGYCKSIPQHGYGEIYVTELGNGLYQIANGHHRVEALRILGEEYVKVYLTK